MKLSVNLAGVLALLVFLVGVMISKISHGKIFAYVDADGKLVISDKQEDDRYKQFDPRNKFISKISGIKQHTLTKYEPEYPAKRYTEIIDEVARDVGINSNLLHAVIQVESAYNPQAISPKGAQGLMQLIPATAARFGVTEVYDPESNIRGGARYLKKLMQIFGDDLKLTLAAYNAGEGAVQKYKNTIPPYPETQAYVERVLDIFDKRSNRGRDSS